MSRFIDLLPYCPDYEEQQRLAQLRRREALYRACGFIETANDLADEAASVGEPEVVFVQRVGISKG
jgi:hypothetical protein